MIPTVQNICDGARSVLGDTQIAVGEVFTNAILLPHYQTAYSELYTALMAAYNPLVICRAFWNVPANTGYINPATMFVENLGAILAIWERGNTTSYAITNTVPGSGICTLTNAATSGLSTGNQAVVYGVGGLTDDVNDEWTVTVNSTTSTRLNGCAATGTYTSGGVLSTSTEMFTELTPVKEFTWDDQTPTSIFQKYVFERGVIRVPPCSSIRQIKLYYQISGNAPLTSTASVGIDNSLEFFKYRVAGQAGTSKGMIERCKQYNFRAVGPRWDTEQTPGGTLAALLMEGVRNLQRQPPALRRPPAWRDHRRRAIW